MWSHDMLNELRSERHSSGDVQVGRDGRCSSESDEMKQFSDESSQKKTEVKEKREENETVLERLRLVRRSESPGDCREDTDNGYMASKRNVLPGGERASVGDERLTVVVREGSVGREGEVEGDGTHGEEGIVDVESRTDRENEEQKQHSEKVDDYVFTLALISRRSRHRAGEMFP